MQYAAHARKSDATVGRWKVSGRRKGKEVLGAVRVVSVGGGGVFESELIREAKREESCLFSLLWQPCLKPSGIPGKPDMR